MGKDPLGIMNPQRGHGIPQPDGGRGKVLTLTGKSGALLELDFKGEGQNSPWGLYAQFRDAGSFAVMTQLENIWYVSLTKQWRPGQRDCVELPAGNLGLGGPKEVAARILKSILAEVGEVDIVRALIGRPFAHDVGREIAASVSNHDKKTGIADVEIKGHKLFIPCVLIVRSEVGFRVHDGEVDEKTFTAMYPIEAAIEMMNNGVILDSITSLVLPAAIRLVRGEEGVWDERFGWEELSDELIKDTLARAHEILAELEQG